MFSFKFFKLFILIFNLVIKAIFRVLVLENNSFSFSNFRLKNFNLLIKISSFSCKFLIDLSTLVLGTILKISIWLFKFLEILIFILNLLHHYFIFLLYLSNDILHISFNSILFFFKSIVVILVCIRHFLDSILIFINLILHLFVMKTFGVSGSLFNLLLFIVIELFNLRKLLSRLRLVTGNKFINFIFFFLELPLKISFFIFEPLFSSSRWRTNIFL